MMLFHLMKLGLKQWMFFPGLSLVVSSLKHYRGSRFSTSSPSSTSGGSF